MLFFVEAPLTGSGLSVVRWAIEHDIDAALVTTDPDKYHNVLSANVLDVVRERNRLYVVSTTEGEDVPPMLVQAAAETGEQPGVVCVTDRHLLFAAAVAEAVKAPFAPVEAIRTFRDKRAARCLYAELDLASARWTEPIDGEALAEFVCEVGGPVVLKNCRGTGSMDVRLCRTPDEARTVFAEMSHVDRYLCGELMAEEYIAGPLYSLETLVVNGECRHLGITDRQLGPSPAFCEVSYTFPVEVPSFYQAKMREAVEVCVKACRIPQGMLHTEFILTAGEPVVVELNARLGGGLLALMMSDCLTVGVPELLCTAALGRPVPDLSTTGVFSSTVTVYPATPGRLVEVQGLDQVVRAPFITQVVSSARPGDEVRLANDYRGSLCQIRTVAGSHNLALNAALAAVRDITAEVA